MTKCPHRFFIDKSQIQNDIAKLSGSDVHHALHVLRLKENDEISLLDGSGKIYAARILDFDKDQLTAKILLSSSLETESNINITIAQCLPKGHKIDLILQKCTELGASRFIPCVSERSVVRIEEDKKENKLARWQKIVKEAAEQSGRSNIPQIDPVSPFEKVLLLSGQFDLCLIPWEMENERSIKEVLKAKKIIKSILILIGPEGGFSQKEIDEAIASNFMPVSLGKRILRAETAGIAALSMINYEFELPPR